MTVLATPFASAADDNRSLIEQGRSAADKNDPKKAIKFFRQAVEQNPQDPEAHYYLAYTLVRTGQTDEGLQKLRKAISLDPGNVNLRMIAGDLFAVANRYQDAIEQFRMVLRLSPNSKFGDEASRRISLAMVNRHVNNGDLDSALFLISSLLEQYPDDQFLFYRQAKILMQANRRKEAEQAFIHLLNINPDHLQARIDLATLYQMMGDLTKSQKQLYEVVKRDPKGRAGKQAALSIAMQRNNKLLKEGRLKDALVNYQEMLRFDPNNPVALVNIAQLAFKLGQKDLALQAYERISQLNPNDASVHFRLGQLYFERRNAQKAIQHLQAVSRLSPDSPMGKQAQQNLAAIRSSLNQQSSGNAQAKQQMKTIEQVIAANPENVKARMDKARILLSSNKLEQARQELETITSLDPDNVLALLNLGQVYETMGLTTEAGIAYAKVSAMDKDGKMGQQASLSVISLGAKRLFNQGKLEQAKKEFKHIVNKDQNNANAHYFLALIHQKNNELESTAKEFKEVIRIKPKNVQARFNLASVYEQLNREDDALQQYRTIVRQSRNTNLAGLAKHRLAKVENRLNGFAFGLDYGLSMDDNTNSGKSGAVQQVVTVDENGDETIDANIPLDPISDHKTDLGVNFAYRLKMTDWMRFRLSASAAYTVYHEQEFDFIRTTTTPSLNIGSYQNSVSLAYTHDDASGLLNTGVESVSHTLRTEYMHRFRMRPFYSLFFGDSDGVSSNIRTVAAYRTMDSSQQAYDAENIFGGLFLTQSPVPGFVMNAGYSLSDHENTDPVGDDFANLTHTFHLGMQKVLFYGIMASMDYSLAGAFHKNYDKALLSEGIEKKRFIVRNNLSLKLNYRYHENLSFSLGYQGALSSANLNLRIVQRVDERLLETQTANNALVLDQFQTPSLGTYAKNLFFLSVKLTVQ